MHLLACLPQLSFSWTVGSEQNFDILTFFLDNVPKAAISGNPGWAVQTVTVGDGTHAAAWCYIKDKSMAEREDRGTIGSVAVRSLTRYYYWTTRLDYYLS